MIEQLLIKICIFSGLEYMVEVQVVDSKKPPHYTCDICDCKLIPGSVLPHLLGLKHKLNFFVSILFI